MATNTVVPAVEAQNNEGPTRDWFDAHRTTPGEQQAATWAADRTQDIEAGKAIKNTLGLEYETHRSQLDALPSAERAALSGMNAEDLTAYLDSLTETERRSEKSREALDKQIEDQKEARLAKNETPQLVEVRHAMQAAYGSIESIDERIAQLKKYNEMREDVNHEGWNEPDMDADTWRLAREKTLGSWDGELAQLNAEKQTRLQEAALHQSTYHAEIQSIQQSQRAQVAAQPRGYSATDAIIARIAAPNGQAVPVSQADIAAVVQLERDLQTHKARMDEFAKHVDTQAIERQRETLKVTPGVVGISEPVLAYIVTLPNSAEVGHHLLFHQEDVRALKNMNGMQATRFLNEISHKVGRHNAAAATPPEPKKTSAPKPVSPVGGSSKGNFDVSDESGTADEWVRQRRAQLARKSSNY